MEKLALSEKIQVKKERQKKTRHGSIESLTLSGLNSFWGLDQINFLL